MHVYLFYICLPLIAFLYSSVGHGGASGYLALLALFSFTATDIKAVALTLNLFVAGIAFIQYYKAGFFDKKLFMQLASTSIPMAYLGGRIELDTQIYFYALAMFLLFASFKLFFSKKKNTSTNSRPRSLPVVLIIGAGIGFLSGLLGIGGGIILSPLILLLAWSTTKVTAGISALFIFVNSAAALLGQFTLGFDYPNSMLLIIALVIVGGLAGSYVGAKKWSPIRVKQLLAAVFFLASLKIFFS